jgi:hypothetical protein
MPATYEIDTSRALVRTTISGHVTDGDLVLHQQRLAADATFAPAMCQLIEVAEVTGLSVTSEGMHAIARANLFGAGSRRAIVAEQDAYYGLARMFQLLRDSAPEQIGVFRGRHEAHAWLGLAAEPDA